MEGDSIRKDETYCIPFKPIPALKTIEDIDKDIVSKYTLEKEEIIFPDRDSYGGVGPLSIGPFQSVKTSGKNLDCLIHSFLTCVSKNFRKLKDDNKNSYASLFRRNFFPTIITDDVLQKEAESFSSDLSEEHAEILTKHFLVSICFYRDFNLQGVGLNLPNSDNFVNPEKAAVESNNKYIFIYNPDATHFRAIRDLNFNPTNQKIDSRYIFDRDTFEAIYNVYGYDKSGKLIPRPNNSCAIQNDDFVQYTGATRTIPNPSGGILYTITQNDVYKIVKTFYQFQTNVCEYFEVNDRPGWAIPKDEFILATGKSLSGRAKTKKPAKLDSILDKYKDISIVKNRFYDKNGKILPIPEIITILENAIKGGEGQIEDLNKRLKDPRRRDKNPIQENIKEAEKSLKISKDLLNEIRAL